VARPISAKAFGVLLRERFPELRAEVDDGIATGLVHMEMSALRLLAEDAVKRRDEDTLKRCYALAEKGLVSGDAALRNAVSLSFLEDMLLYVHEAEKWAEALLPNTLRADLENTRTSYEAPGREKDD
jgi:hypothetical protein